MFKKINNENDKFLEENKIIFKKFRPLKKIDEGSFGNIYSVIRLTDKNIFSMKTESKNSPQNTLEQEAYFLYRLQGGFGIPKFISYGYTKNYNVLIETLLGRSLYTLFIKKEIKCKIIDTCLIGIQILDRLKWIHSKDIIYRDIKPENFLIGINDPNIIYVVDFGLCKKYRSSKTGKHILFKKTGKFSGTLIYASSNVVKGMEASRRDDLISLGYMLIYLLKRNLPWESSFKNLDKYKYNELINLKETDGNNLLFKNIPKEFVEYIKYTKSLKFEQAPDYSYLQSLFKKVLIKLNLNYKYLTFSWINPKNKSFLELERNNSNKKSHIKNRIPENVKNKKIIKKKSISSNDISKEVKDSNYINNVYSNINNCKLNINNLFSEKIILNNLNNINSERIFLGNNNIKYNNIYSEKIFVNNNNININKMNILNTLRNKNYMNNEFFQKEEDIINKRRNNSNSVYCNNKNVFINKNNVISEIINLNNFSLNKNKNNTINVNIKGKKIKSLIKEINHEIKDNFNNNNKKKLNNEKIINIIHSRKLNNTYSNVNNINLYNNINYKSPLLNIDYTLKNKNLLKDEKKISLNKNKNFNSYQYKKKTKLRILTNNFPNQLINLKEANNSNKNKSEIYDTINLNKDINYCNRRNYIFYKNESNYI